jgi:hypothetical protein
MVTSTAASTHVLRHTLTKRAAAGSGRVDDVSTLAELHLDTDQRSHRLHALNLYDARLLRAQRTAEARGNTSSLEHDPLKFEGLERMQSS